MREKISDRMLTAPFSRASTDSLKLPILGQGTGLSDFAAEGNLTEFTEDQPLPGAILYIDDPNTDAVLELIRERRIAGLVTSSGNLYSHAAILARSLKFPAVFNFKPESDFIMGQKVILDAARGMLLEVKEDRSFIEISKELIDVPEIEAFEAYRDEAEEIAFGLSTAELNELHALKTKDLIRLAKQENKSQREERKLVELNFETHFLHLILNEREEKERKLGYAEMPLIILDEENLPPYWSALLNKSIRLEMMPYGVDDDTALMKRNKAALLNAVREIPKIKELIAKYGDDLEFRIDQRKGPATNGRHMLRVRVLKWSKARSIYKGTVNYSYWQSGQKYSYGNSSNPDVAALLDAAEKEAENARSQGMDPRIVFYVRVDDWHERGVDHATWNVEVYVPLPENRPEIRQAAANIIEMMKPDTAKVLEESAARNIYEVSVSDLEGLTAAIEEVLEKKIAAFSKEKSLALQGALDLAGKLLVPKAGDLPRKINFAVNFSQNTIGASLFEEILKQLSGNSVTAEILLNSRAHAVFSRRIVQKMAEFIQLKKLTEKELQGGTTVSEEGLGVITAIDNTASAEAIHAMFQGLFFDEEGMAQDPDVQLAGQVLFAAFLIKLAVLSMENKDKKVPNRAVFLKSELIRAIGEAGYSNVEAKALEERSGIIRILGNALVDALIQDMKTRAEIRKAA